MGDSDIFWSASSSYSSSKSWIADTMDWECESDETDPAETIMPLNWVNGEEVESQASNKPEPTSANTSSIVKDFVEEPVVEHSSTVKEEPRRGFMYGGVFWNETWEKDMDLYDDLDDWHCAGDESSKEDPEEEDPEEEDPEEDLDNDDNSSKDPSGDTPPCEG